MLVRTIFDEEDIMFTCSGIR